MTIILNSERGELTFCFSKSRGTAKEVSEIRRKHYTFRPGAIQVSTIALDNAVIQRAVGAWQGIKEGILQSITFAGAVHSKGG